MELKTFILKCIIIKHDIMCEILLYGPSLEVRKILVAFQQETESISPNVSMRPFHIFALSGIYLNLTI